MSSRAKGAAIQPKLKSSEAFDALLKPLDCHALQVRNDGLDFIRVHLRSSAADMSYRVHQMLICGLYAFDLPSQRMTTNQ